jgi:hypothetical protein
MINFHLEAPAIAADHSVSLIRVEASRAAWDRCTRTRHIFENAVGPNRYCRSKDLKALDELFEVSCTALETPSLAMPTFVSEPELLGIAEDLVWPRSAYWVIEKRLERLYEDIMVGARNAQLPKLKGVTLHRKLKTAREARLFLTYSVLRLPRVARDHYLTDWHIGWPRVTVFLLVASRLRVGRGELGHSTYHTIANFNCKQELELIGSYSEDRVLAMVHIDDF